jgi:hypothetical protein
MRTYVGCICLALVACASTPPAQTGGCPSGTVLKGDDCVPPEDSSGGGGGSASSLASDEHQEELVKGPSRLSSDTGSGSGSGSSSGTGTGAGTGTGTSSGADATEAGPKKPYDKSTEVVLNRAARQVKANCGSATDDDGKANGPWGKTKVSVTLGRNGHSRDVSVPAPFDGKPTGRCAVQAFKSLTFPPYAAPNDVIVDWDVEIVQPGK